MITVRIAHAEPRPGNLDARFGPDYSCAAEGQSAVLTSAVPEPRGSAARVQAIFADDYRGATVTFRGEFRIVPGSAAGRADPRLLTC